MMNDKKMPSGDRPSGMGMLNKTPGTMAKKSALSRAASAAKKTNLPAKAGDSGMKSTMPAMKGMPLKKKNLSN